MSRRAARPGPFSVLAAFVFASLAAAAALPSGCAREAPCSLNSDCADGYCQDGVCKKNCVDAVRDCPAGWTCNVNAQCVPPDGTSTSSSSGFGGGSSSSSSSSGFGGQTSSSSSSSSSSSGASSSSSSSSTGGPATKHELELCATDGECAAPLVCRGMFPGGQKRCTRLCSSTGQCMTGTVCQAIGSEMYCAGEDTGRTCTAGGDCNYACVTNQQYCTKQCSTGADCPNGYGCQPYAGQKVCVLAEAYCESGSQCTVACDTSATLWVSGCTTQCTSAADCPQRAAGLSPWSCNGGYCSRPADVVGPLPGGDPALYVNNCQGKVVNVCNDNQHMDFTAFTIPNPPAAACGAQTPTDGAPGDSCVNSCRYQGGCSYGFACVAVGGINNNSVRIGLCLPTGFIEVGAPCANDTQCAFGYCVNNKCSRDCTKDGICPGGTTCVDGGTPAVEGQPFKRCQ